MAQSHHNGTIGIGILEKYRNERLGVVSLSFKKDTNNRQILDQMGAI